ncbi:MAG: sensor histidine kinase [Dehalococcoidia bacterium]
MPVAELVAGAVTAASGAARERDVRVRIDVRGVAADGGPPAVRADAAWLTRALANVLDNAVRYAPRGGVVDVDAWPGPTGGMVAIRVSDAGPGMPPAVAARAFERFFRADPARAKGNSGLGLAIAREIVEAHGGAIELSSTEGRGRW